MVTRSMFTTTRTDRPRVAARLNDKLDFMLVAIAPARLGVNKALVFFDEVKDSFKLHLVVFFCGPMS